METAVKTKKKKRWIKWVVIAAVVVVIVVLALLGGKNKGALPGNYTMEAAQVRDITVTVSSTGTVKPESSSQLILPVSAEVLEVRARAGDSVKKGDILCVLDTTDYEATLLQCQNSVRAAEIAVEQAELSLENAGSSAASVSDTYSDLTLKARAYSQVNKIYYKVGDTVAAGSPVVLLRDSSSMLLELPFNASDAAGIAVGAAAKVSVTSSGDSLSGTVTKVSSVDTVTSYGGIVRTVTISVKNPGAVTESTRATASVGDYSCAGAGAFSYSETETLYAAATGTLGSVIVDEGGWVAAGGAVATIESDSVQSQQTSSQNGVQAAQLSLESAKMTLENAKRALEDAQKIMDEHTVRAKIDGVVAAINVEVGSKTVPTVPIAEVYCLDTVKFDMNIDELDIVKLKTGLKASITADAVAGETFSGVITAVGISGAGAAGVTTYPVTVTVAKPGGLLPGMNVSADVIVDSASGVLTIPVSAVSRGNTVLAADSEAAGDAADGIPAGYKRVSVELGRSDENYIEVLSGLSEGDMVAIDTTTSSAMEFMY